MSMYVGEELVHSNSVLLGTGGPAYSDFYPGKRGFGGLPSLVCPGCGMWGSMLNELTNHSHSRWVFSLRSRWCPIGHHPLPSCAASADASQLEILLCQCRILRKGRRHREEAGPVGNQEISCFALGPGKRPLTTGSWALGRSACRFVSRHRLGEDTPHGKPPLLSTELSLGRVAFDLIRR